MTRVTIEAICDETDRIRSYVLVPAPGEPPLTGFDPGAHIVIKLGNGLSRQYSLCNPASATPRHYEIAVLREDFGRGGSAWIHENWKKGDIVQVTGCSNHFPLNCAAERYLLMAGGIGITPLISMAERLHSAGKIFTLVYCARTRTDAAFTARLLASEYADRLQFIYSKEPSRKRLDITNLVHSQPAETHFYFCGPAGFISAIRDASSGRPEKEVHYEFFNADPKVDLSRDRDGPFEVVIRSTGQKLSIPADRTILEVLEENGFLVEKLCEEGYCGSCLTGVTSGRPDHRDTVQTAEERATNTMMTVCCSRALSREIELDL